MNDLPFLVETRAFVGYMGLSPKDREAVNAAVLRLVDLPEERWSEAGAVRLASVEPLYLLRPDKSLRAFVRPAAGGQPELMDLVRQELLDRYFKESGRSGAKP